jgi:hypothetical protein
MARKARKAASISNLAMAGVLVFAALAIGVLGGLFYSLHKRSTVEPVLAQTPESPPADRVDVPKTVKADDDGPVIRVVSRSGLLEATAEAPAQIVAAKYTPTAPESSDSNEASRAAVPEQVSQGGLDTAGAGVVTSKESNELIPEINGPSYTAKKAMSNALDPNSKPAGRRPGARPPEPKKPVTVPPVPPKTPAKIEGPKPPALPPMDARKVDISKAPVYVLNDGRRIRALMVRENGMTITVKNEAGTDITFKKSDVKQILR